MRARVEKSTLAAAIKVVLPAARASGIAICSGVRLDADGERLRLTTTDLDLTISHEIEIADGEGSAVVPAALLARVISSLDEGAVTLAWADSMLAISCGEAVARLHGFNLEDWPHLPHQDGESIVLEEAELDLIRRIVPFASTTHDKKALHCVHFGDRQAATTDSYRMGLADIGLDIADCNIPAAMFTTMLRHASAPVSLTAGSRSASLQSQHTTWTTRLVVDDYPKLRGLIPKPSRHLTFAAASLEESLDRLMVTAGDDSPRVRIAVQGDKAMLSSSEADVGSMDDVVACSGDFEGSLCFDPRFLAELVVAAGADEVTLGLVDALKPTVVLSERLTQVLMPVRP